MPITQTEGTTMEGLNHSNKKRSKKNNSSNGEEEIPPVPAGWTRCHAYNQRKRRYCRQLTLKNAQYCGNHQEYIVGVTTSTNTDENKEQRKRIPCPLDPSHTIYEDTLKRHLKKCPKARNQRELENQPYYQFNVNAGGHGSLLLEARKEGSTVTTATIASPMEQAKQLALQVLVVHQRLFRGKECCHEDVKQLTQQDIDTALPLHDFSCKELDVGLAKAMDSYNIKSGGPKHLHQLASLLGHLKQRTSPTTTTANSNSTLVLELGAGRGMLGLLAAGAFAKTSPNIDLMMVDQGAIYRGKADTILRNHQSTLDGRCLHIEQIRKWKRIQCDLAHVHMPTVLLEDNKTCDNKNQPPANVLAIAKHLCGAGTDLALKALYPVKDQIQLCVMATCCHGLCTWEHYVGRDCLTELLVTKDPNGVAHQFGPDGFELLRLWSSGTVKQHNVNGTNNASSPITNKRPKTEKEEEKEETHQACHHSTTTDSNNKAISVKDVVAALNLRCGVRGLGRACQRLLDYGRKQYLEQVLFASDANNKANAQVELCYYVQSSVTPQNAVLVAWRRRKGDGTT